MPHRNVAGQAVVKPTDANTGGGEIVVSSDVPASHVGSDADVHGSVYADWSDIFATTPGLNIRLLRHGR
jgi:hypothetical protein